MTLKAWKKIPSKVAYNPPRPFYFTVQPRPQPTAQKWYYEILGPDICSLIWLWRSRILTFKVNFLCQKSSESLEKKFSLKNMKLGAQLSLMTLFVKYHFWSTLFTKIGAKFQTLISNRGLICQRPFTVRKCYLPFN